jgi:phosphoglycerol transferase
MTATRFSRSHLAFGAALLAAFAYLVARSDGLYPQVFADEWLYNQFSRLKPLSESTLPSFLFLGLYRATSACGPAFLDCARVLNVALLVGSAPLIYLVGRPIAGRSAAMVVAVASVLAPFSAFTAYFMPEPLYFFGFWAMSWLVLQRGRPGLAFGLQAGAVLGVLALIKVHALFLLPALMAYLAWLGWRSGALRAGLLGAGAALVSAIAVKLLLGGLLAGENGFGLLGSFYGNHVSNSSGRSPLTLIQPMLLNFSGHALGLLLVFCVPLLFIASGAARSAGRAALGQQGRALLLYTALMLGMALAMTVAYTASIADTAEFEGVRLHLRYYSFTFPLLLIAAAACVMAAPPAQRQRIIFAVIGIVLLFAAVKLLPRYFHLMYVDSPELAAATRNSRALRTGFAVSLIAAAAWAWRPSAGRALLLWLVLPATCISAGMTSRLALMGAQEPDLYDRAGIVARAELTPEQRASLTIIGPDYGRLMRTNFQLDVAGPALIPLPDGEPLNLRKLPEEGWLLLIGGYEPPPYALKRAGGEGFALWQLVKPAPNYDIDFRREFPADIISGSSGLGGIEEWGRWSEGGRIELQFAQPLPARLTLRLTAHAFGPNAGKDIVVSVGSRRRILRLSGDWAKQALSFDNPGGENAIVLEIPQPVSPKALGMSGDGRMLGIAVHQMDIGTLAAAIAGGARTASQHDHR